jgi:hypothetical protein
LAARGPAAADAPPPEALAAAEPEPLQGAAAEGAGHADGIDAIRSELLSIRRLLEG